MSEHVESVKAAAAYLRSVAAKNPDRSDVVERVIPHADALDLAVHHMRRLEDLTTASPPDLGNLSDLPQELREELSVAKTDDLEDQIVTVINSYGGEASLDQVLVGLYRKFGVVQKRRFLQNKLYRMEMVWGVGGKKGVYTTQPPPLEALAKSISSFSSAKEAARDDDEDSEVPF